MPILLHGDAAFAGQGVVAETLNLEALEGYSTGGTLHLITNNQIGFTTDPAQGRSTRYSSDLAKGFDIPIVHVNGDDPEAAITAVRLALAYRRRFGHDVVIDLVGYRRFGHNEQDEAAYTQPLMVERIERHPTVRELYAARLVDEGVLTADEAEALDAEVTARLRAAHERLRASFAEGIPEKTHDERVPRGYRGKPIETAVPEERLRGLNEELLRVPDGFTVHPKLARQLERRRDALDSGGIDWGHAEALAFASLLADGTPIRLTGQDTERGTFSQRHLVLHDPTTGARHTPMQHLAEVGGVVRGLQLAALRVRLPRLRVRLLDRRARGARALGGAVRRLREHGADGDRPVHLERAREVEGDLAARRCSSRTATRATAPSTRARGSSGSSSSPRRRTCGSSTARPRRSTSTSSGGEALVEIAAAARRDDAEGAAPAQGGLLDPRRARRRRAGARCSTTTTVPDKAPVRRLVLCSGKVYYDIVGHQDRAAVRDQVAVARIEQLYPFPVQAARELIASYPSLDEIVWAQEEPQNMGAWRTIRHRLEEAAAGIPVRFVGRPWRASSAEGYPTAHLVEQDRIARAATLA